MKNIFRIFMRLLVLPFVLGILLVTYILGAIERGLYFVKYGGEFINYDKNEKITIQMIYEQLKNKEKNE